MPRKRSNPPRRWWEDKRRLARKLRASLLIVALLVGALAFANIRYVTAEVGPLGLPIGLWRGASFVIYILGLGFVLWAVIWLKRNDELPKEKREGAAR